MQAIIAKYLPATNFRPSRVKASCERGSIIVSYDDGSSNGGIGSDYAFKRAVDMLCARFAKEDEQKYGSKPTDRRSWTRPKAHGQILSGEWVFCFVEDKK